MFSPSLRCGTRCCSFRLSCRRSGICAVAQLCCSMPTRDNLTVEKIETVASSTVRGTLKRKEETFPQQLSLASLASPSPIVRPFVRPSVGSAPNPSLHLDALLVGASMSSRPSSFPTSPMAPHLGNEPVYRSTSVPLIDPFRSMRERDRLSLWPLWRGRYRCS